MKIQTTTEKRTINFSDEQRAYLLKEYGVDVGTGETEEVVYVLRCSKDEAHAIMTALGEYAQDTNAFSTATIYFELHGVLGNSIFRIGEHPNSKARTMVRKT